MLHDYVALTKQIVLQQVDKLQYDVFLFGSRATALHHEMSDIDIGFSGKEPLPVLIKSAIEENLEQSIVPFKVDLVDFSKVSDSFRNQALKKVVYWNKVNSQ